MDWDSKLSQWEIPELETNHLHPNQITLNPISINSSPSQFHQISLKDCSIDLKLGGGTDQSGAATCPKGVQPPVKRARGPTNQAQMIVLCSVDGCGSDLSSCRDYHRRHKVCESHSKTPVVLVGGKEQRFCQQCSRFHMLTEFDEVKRSCRKRLDGHNRRRRKPQPDSVNNHHTSLLSNHHQVSQFSNYASVFRTSIPEPTWSSPGSKALISKTLISHPYLARAPTQPPFSLSFPQNLKETKCFPFLYDSNPTSNPNFSSESSGSSSGGGNSNKIIYSECALSLLSSSPPPSAAAPTALSVSVGPTCQSLYPGYQYPGPPSVTGTGFHMEDLDSDSRIGIETGNASLGFHCQDMFVSNEGPGLGDGASHALPFWHH